MQESLFQQITLFALAMLVLCSVYLWIVKAKFSSSSRSSSSHLRSSHLSASLSSHSPYSSFSSLSLLPPALSFNRIELAALSVGALREKAIFGDGDALIELAERYHEGQNVSQDIQRAIFFYEQALMRGHLLAAYLLGKMYYDGNGVEEDHAKALLYYKKAAKQGFSFAEHSLLKMYEDGGVKQTATKSSKWFY